VTCPGTGHGPSDSKENHSPFSNKTAQGSSSKEARAVLSYKELTRQVTRYPVVFARDRTWGSSLDVAQIVSLAILFCGKGKTRERPD
jgi:hypothetical protein